MSSDMKLIMESFRDFFAREQEIENPENPKLGPKRPPLAPHGTRRPGNDS